MQDEGVIYLAGHPLLNRRCTRLPGSIRLRNDLYCVEWGVKLYSLTHPLLGRSDEAEKERKRHDLAIEALQRAESEYQHKRRPRLDYLNQ